MKLPLPGLVAALAAATAATAQPLPPPPAFPPGDTVDTIQGVRIADPYRALEDGADPKVQAWSDAQNARTRQYLDNIPGRAAVAAKLKRLITAASPAYAAVQARGSYIFALYNDPARQQPSLVRLNAAADPASRASVLDPNSLDPSGHTEIDWYVASPDGTKVAISLSRNGSEDGTLHVYDVASGREIGAPISQVQYPTAGGSVAWTADGRAFWYTRYPTSGPETEKHFNLQAYFHRLDAAAGSDPLVLGAADGLPRTGEIFLSNDEAAPAAVAAVQLGDGGQWQVWVLKPGAKALKVARYEDRVVAAAMAKDGTLYGLSRLNAPKGKVLKLSAPYDGGFEKAVLFAPEEADAAIVDGGEFGRPLVAAGHRLAVARIAGGPSRLAVYDAPGEGRPISIPPIAAVDDVTALPDGDLLYRVATYLEPPYYARWGAGTGESVRTRLAVTSPITFDDAAVTRAFATSKDGARVPLNIIAAKGTVLDGSHPVLLYGYGGYGVNLTPRFLGAMRRLWLDAGGIYVEANIRGGGEYGDDWHLAGALTRKQNVFDDFAAAADWLVASGYTTHDRLALMGGSNGGLLMGAEVTQHPALARAVVSAVGIYDMIRVELDPNGAFNVTEFGTVQDPAQFKALYAYSPYHHVKKGAAYPAVLMLTGANDGRVNPLNSRKFAAALQAATSSDRPILLRTSKTSGHGIGSSLDDRIAEQTDELMFLFDQLGMSAEQASR
jgi:prolyl oligopeptidase